MSHLRRVLAAIHAHHPQALCRVIDAGNAALTVASVDELAAHIAEGLPPTLTCGAVTLRCGQGPQDLVEDSATCAGDLAGRVVLVSGAASGLGRGIAAGMHAAGACVVVTDIDEDGCRAVVTDLGEDRALAVRIDVTDEQSVADGFEAALARFGRLDGLVCAAGVAPPYELVDFPVDKWRLALEINLTGYFLCGREAARIMKNLGHGGAMVLLSSKSGLEPSKANSAYNATKAGELHLARGWALELGKDGIRVNCIAPGNVFEGSKIWNPDYIAKAAEKKGITPEEVIPYYNSLTALNAEIKPQDIADAAIFLCSDRSRRITGQVLPVDAGQVWTR